MRLEGDPRLSSTCMSTSQKGGALSVGHLSCKDSVISFVICLVFFFKQESWAELAQQGNRRRFVTVLEKEYPSSICIFLLPVQSSMCSSSRCARVAHDLVRYLSGHSAHAVSNFCCWFVSHACLFRRVGCRSMHDGSNLLTSSSSKSHHEDQVTHGPYRGCLCC